MMHDRVEVVRRVHEKSTEMSLLQILRPARHDTRHGIVFVGTALEPAAFGL